MEKKSVKEKKSADTIKNTNEENVKYIDKAFKEIVSKSYSVRRYTEAEIKQKMQELEKGINFFNNLDDIKLDKGKEVVLFVDGASTLSYNDGIFYISDSVSSKKKKKQIERVEATNMYIEFVMKYVLNPLQKNKNVKIIGENANIYTISRNEKNKEVTKKKISSKVLKEKNKEDNINFL